MKQPRPAMTQSQRRVYDAIRDAIRKDGRPPTLKELSCHLGISTITISDHLRCLSDRGWIEVTPRKWRGIRILEDPRRILWPQPVPRVMKLDPKLLGLLCFISRKVYLDGYPPTEQEMADSLGLSQSTIRDKLLTLEYPGVMIRKFAGQTHKKNIRVRGYKLAFSEYNQLRVYWYWKDGECQAVAGRRRSLNIIGPFADEQMLITDEGEWLDWCEKRIEDARQAIRARKERLSKSPRRLRR